MQKGCLDLPPRLTGGRGRPELEPSGEDDQAHVGAICSRKVSQRVIWQLPVARAAFEKSLKRFAFDQHRAIQWLRRLLTNDNSHLRDCSGCPARTALIQTRMVWFTSGVNKFDWKNP